MSDRRWLSLLVHYRIRGFVSAHQARTQIGGLFFHL
jgi:hypothetical protein